MEEKGLTTRNVGNYLPQHITKDKAMYLLQTIWPEAPEVEVIKAAMLCEYYGLNPLLRKVYLIKFGNELVTKIKGGDSFIRKTMVHGRPYWQKCRYIYVDGKRKLQIIEHLGTRKPRGKG